MRDALRAAGLPVTPVRLSDVFPPRPPRAWNRKLTDADAIEIRRRYARGESPTDLARMYGIGRQAIYKIVDGTHYRERTAA